MSFPTLRRASSRRALSSSNFHANPPQSLLRWEDELLFLESQISLVEALTPVSFEQQVGHAQESLERGNVPRFDQQCALRPLRVDPSQVLRRLAGLRSLLAHATDGGPWAAIRELLVLRVDELCLETRMVEGRFTPELPSLSLQRFRFTEAELRAAECVAEDWIVSPSEPLKLEEPTVPLALGLARLASQERLHVPIFERDMAAIAAVSDQGVCVRRGACSNQQEVERIFRHEVCGHHLPRVRAKRLPPPYRIGTVGCTEDEEGRAVLLEARGGYLTARRRAELSVRFLLASAARKDPKLACERALELVRTGAETAAVARALCRVLRGGGLAREVVYLPAYLRVEATLEFEPQLEAYMAAGRISLTAARTLSAHGFLAPAS